MGFSEDGDGGQSVRMETGLSRMYLFCRRCVWSFEIKSGRVRGSLIICLDKVGKCDQIIHTRLYLMLAVDRSDYDDDDPIKCDYT